MRRCYFNHIIASLGHMKTKGSVLKKKYIYINNVSQSETSSQMYQLTLFLGKSPSLVALCLWTFHFKNYQFLLQLSRVCKSSNEFFVATKRISFSNAPQLKESKEQIHSSAAALIRSDRLKYSVLSVVHQDL